MQQQHRGNAFLREILYCKLCESYDAKCYSPNMDAHNNTPNSNGHTSPSNQYPHPHTTTTQHIYPTLEYFTQGVLLLAIRYPGTSI